MGKKLPLCFNLRFLFLGAIVMFLLLVIPIYVYQYPIDITRTGAISSFELTPIPGQPFGVELSKNGKYLFVATSTVSGVQTRSNIEYDYFPLASNQLLKLKTESMKEVGRAKLKEGEEVICMALSSKNNQVALMTRTEKDFFISLFDQKDLRLLHRCQIPLPNRPSITSRKYSQDYHVIHGNIFSHSDKWFCSINDWPHHAPALMEFSDKLELLETYPLPDRVTAIRDTALIPEKGIIVIEDLIRSEDSSFSSYFYDYRNKEFFRRKPPENYSQMTPLLGLGKSLDEKLFNPYNMHEPNIDLNLNAIAGFDGTPSKCHETNYHCGKYYRISENHQLCAVISQGHYYGNGVFCEIIEMGKKREKQLVSLLQKTIGLYVIQQAHTPTISNHVTSVTFSPDNDFIILGHSGGFLSKLNLSPSENNTR